MSKQLEITELTPELMAAAATLGASLAIFENELKKAKKKAGVKL